MAHTTLAWPASASWRSVPIVTLIGLCLALGGPPLYAHVIAPVLVPVWPDPITQGLFGLGIMWLLAGSCLALGRVWTADPWLPFKRRTVTWRGLGLGIGLGVVCGASVPLLGGIAKLLIADNSGPSVATFAASVPVWAALLAVLTAACTEEVLYRGFAVEAGARLTGRVWIGAVLGLSAFVLQHLGGWSLSHTLGVVLPLGALYTGLYIWRRNLPLLILVHFVTDLPLVLASAGILRVGS